MSLKNYTTTVSAFKTIAEIEEFLAKKGCSYIQKEYDGGEPIGILFTWFRSPDLPVNYKLPADWEACLKIFSRDSKMDNRYKTKEQAIRTSWRIIKDWITAQMALIETEMVSMEQVFLPYMVDQKGNTMFDYYLQYGPKQLMEGIKK